MGEYGNIGFRFKQFELRHDRCAMKVGTDGVLLGSWADCTDIHHVLDVGTGCGVIAMMLAQRNPDARILGIDIDPDAVDQARKNFQCSPFADRLEAEVYDFTTQFTPATQASARQSSHHFLREPSSEGFLIVSNPPFFTEDTRAPNAARATARSNSALPFSLLIEHSAQLLSDRGRFAVIIPHEHATDFILTAANLGLHLRRRCDVNPSTHKPPKRTLLEFDRQSIATHFETLCLNTAEGTKSEAYQKLTADFYL